MSKTLTGTVASTTIYAYDASGQLSAEYSTAVPGETGTAYLLGDHLVSTRLVTNATGSAIQRFDYAPFGEDESAYGLGNRNLMTSYGVSGVPTVKFTGKERDAESGLDYFGFRYYSGSQGRWTSPDEPFADQHPEDPQSWNMYGYVRNNPIKNTDPDGRDCQSGAAACAGTVGNYILGGVGAVANAVSSNLINAPNRIANAVISPFTNFRFSDLVPAAFTPANDDQRQGEQAANAVMLVSPSAEAPEAAATAATEAPLITQNAARGAESEARVLDDMGLTKNTTPITGTAGRSIPDINTSTMVGDIKDVKVVSNTPQIQIQREVAGQTGREHVTVTGTNTHVTAPTQKPPTRIIRRDDLGPHQ